MFARRVLIASYSYLVNGYDYNMYKRKIIVLVNFLFIKIELLSNLKKVT